jgi:RHH-type rel operon transcriptional repressor/antitoxin RelB
MIAAGCPVERQQQIQDIAKAAGRKEAEVVREAIAQYWGKTDSSSVKGAITDLQSRLATVERKLAGLGQLVG